MGLLDRFRAQPRWKHSNPATRLVAVQELPLDQQDTLVSIAREDRDAAVRIAALKKILSPATIVDIARADAEDHVRSQATNLLLDLALGAFEGTDEAESLAALGGLSEQKHLLAAAREAGSEAVARAALDRLAEPAALGSVARRSIHAPVRMHALSRLEDEGEIAAVALRGEFKDVTSAAVERLTDRARLEEVAARAKNKTAAKRARAHLREVESASRPQAAPAPSQAELAEAGRRTSAAGLCRRLEALIGSGLDEADATIAEADRSWHALEMPADDPLTARFAAARARVEAALSEQLADRAERTRRSQLVAEAVAARRALCEQLDAVAGDETPGRLEEAKSAWAALDACPDDTEAARWARRFEDTWRAAAARYQELLAQRGRRDKAARLCDEAARLADAAVFPKARGDWQGLRREWGELVALGFDDAELLARFAEAEGRIRAREAEAREQRAREQQENLVRLEGLCVGFEELVASPGLTLKQAERALRDARSALDETGPLPSRDDHARLTDRLKKVLSALFPRVQELRDMDDWQRWANAGVQEELCQRVERLLQEDDLALAARQLREAQVQWKQVATAPRDQSQVLWARFKAATDAVRARCDVYFARLAEEQASNQVRKEALCQQAEALSASTDWLKTAEAIKALQAEWKKVGPAPRTQEKALWERFHAACDGFFTRRRDDLHHRKEEWAANLERKEALCAQAEATAETTEWAKGLEEIKRLQAEWKAVGPVRKARADLVWQRFRAACDHFFERYQQRDQAASSTRVAEAEAIVHELESIAAAGGAADDPPEGLREKTLALREGWLAVVATLPRDRALRFGDRYSKAVTRIVQAWPASFEGTEWDPENNIRRMEELCVQVEQLTLAEQVQVAAAAEGTDDTPATLLARQLREALASNTIGGRQDDAARWKAAAEQVRAAQAAWRHIGPAPEAASRLLNARFQRACAQVSERVEQRRRGPAAR